MKNLKNYISTKVKRLVNYKALLILLFVFITNLISAQDIILLKDGSEIKAKVLEINDESVKYKKADYLEGPTYFAKKSTIFYVKYQDGKKEVFKDEPDIMKSSYVEPPKQAAENNSSFDPDKSDFADKKRKNFSGPRVGITYVGPGTTADHLNKEGKNPFLTQFGWQFEGRLFTIEDGTTGLIEFVPLLGGIEQGLLLPSASFLLGLRSGRNSSFEFAIGPNFGLKANYKDVIVGSMGVVIAVGTSFKKGNVWFPVNLAFVPSVGSLEEVEDPVTNTKSKVKFQSGYRIALIVGFNSRRR